MRNVRLAMVVALACVIPSLLFGQGGGNSLSITNYQLVSQQSVNSTQSRVAYRADLVNPGGGYTSVAATVTSLDPFTIRTLTGQDTLNFAPVPANSQVTSSNTFTVLVTGAVPPDFTKLQWSFQTTVKPVIANAGSNQSATVGSTITLNGSGSSNPSGIGTLTYSWVFVSRPPGTLARLMNTSSPFPSFVVDAQGDYIIQLTVNNGVDSDSATVTVSTNHTPPVANAGPNQTATVGATVVLNGSGSSDVDGSPLTYLWTFLSRPAGSTATLTGATTVSPTFVLDKPGTYMVQLIVTDDFTSSAPSTVTITTENTPPVANAGPNQVVNTGTLVQLNGSGSTDANGYPLTYLWTFLSRPANSAATLSNPTAVNPTFTADLAGTYMVQLIVNDGFVNSVPSTVTITTTAMLPPTAIAGPNQTVPPGIIVTLNGSGTDPQGQALTFKWALLTKPAGSAATLSSTTIPNPAFLADLPGQYVAQLIVNNGFLNSAPSTVTVTATSIGPVTFLPSLLNLGSAPGTTTMLLSAPAGTGGMTVNLASSNTNVATVPASVTVPQGASSTTVTVTPGNNNGAATITASVSGNVLGTFTVSVTLPTITITLPGTVGLTQTVNGSLTLSAPAPPSGLSVTLSANPAGFVNLPASVVTIPGGGTTGAFSLTGAAQGSTAITASAAGYTSGTVNVTVGLLGLIQLPFSPVTVGTNQSVPFPVNLATFAPSGGVTITLTSSDLTKVTVTPSVFIPFGSTTPANQPQVTGIAFGSATITASAPGFQGGSQAVQVTGALSFSPATLAVGTNNTRNLTLTLSAPAPAGGQTINLSSSNPGVATVPPTAIFPAGGTTVNVPVTGVTVGSAVIHASALPFLADTTASVTVQLLTINLPANVTVGAGQSVAFPLSLSVPAPFGGLTVTLTSSDPSKVAVPLANVSIAQGTTTPAVQPQVTGVSLGSATITASAPGFTPASQVVSVTATMVLSCPATVTSGATIQCTLTLSTPAPSGGLTINLSSSNTAVATVPATVIFAANTITVSVPVTGVGGGSATIHASALPIVPDTTANVTVPSVGTILPPAVTVVTAGQTVAFPVTLSTPALSITTVTLTSSDISKLTVTPASVSIAPGATTPAVQPQVTGVNAGTASIVAAAQGWTGFSLVVQVTAAPAPTIKFSPASLTITAPATQNLTLLLSAAAPAGGLTINLSSSNAAVATVPTTVTFAQGAISVNVPVTGLAAGSATITAGATNITNTTASITVLSPPIILPANVIVAPGQSAPFPVTLTNPAPSGGVFITLTSSDTTIATVSPTNILISQGLTAPSYTPKVNGIAAGAVIITATASGMTASQQVIVGTSSPTLTISFSPTSATIAQGATQNLALNLSGSAPAGGLTVTLNSSNTAVATVPTTAAFAAGTASVTVPVTGVAVGGPVTITASATGIASATASVTVTSQPSQPSIGLPNVTVGLNQTAAFPVTLANPAPSGGVFITLTSSDTTKVTVSPTAIIINQGQTQSTQPKVTGVNFGSVTITASASGYTPGIGQVQVASGVTLSFSPASATIAAGTTQNLTLNLSAAAPAGGQAINLSSNNTGVASVPLTVTIPANGISVSVPVTAVGAGSATITASAPSLASAAATITVTDPAPIILPAAMTLMPGETENFPVTLGTAAPAGGVFISLVSSDPTKVTVSPANIIISQGMTTTPVTPKVTGVNFGPATITATASGLGSVSQQVQVTAAIGFPPGTVTIPPGATQNLSLSLSGPAPAGGLTVNLVSSNTAVATAPASVTFVAGTTSVNVPVTGVAVGGPVTITASATGIASAIATVIVGGTPAIILPVFDSLGEGSAEFPVSLSTPAPSGGLTVALTSSDTTRFTVTPSIFFPAGATTPATPAQLTASLLYPNYGYSTITATASGYTQASLTIRMSDAITISLPANWTVGLGQSGPLPFALPTPAPAGGLNITLTSSDPSTVSVQPSVFIPAGMNLPPVPPLLTGVNFGTVTITAAAPTYYYTTGVQTIQVVATLSFSPATLTITGTAAANLTLNLSGAAPPGGLTISLGSNNPGVATVPSSVTIAQGTTSAIVPVTGSGTGLATIIASAVPGVPTTSATVTRQ